MMYERILIVHNPAAGRRHTHQLVNSVAAGLHRLGHTVDLAVTRCPGDATRLAAEAVAEGYDRVVAAGGDGTVNETLQSLVGTSTVLGELEIQGERAWRNLPKASALIAPAPILQRHLVAGRARAIRIVTRTPLPLQVEGDFGGCTSLTIRVAPRALHVTVRAGRSGGLISESAQSA